ncbi:MAG: ABC transporter ATP-binding protein [bacterium]
MIQTVRLCRFYQHGSEEIRAVNDVNMKLKKGEFLGIVGASGSGKSTILNLLAGLDSATSGQIEYEGVALSSLNRTELSAYRAKKVGMIFQSFNLIAHLTALQNVELALYFCDIPANQRKLKASEMLKQIGLGERMDHKPGSLSGGEQQRVAIARALVKRPEILFADEPTGNLDQENSQLIAELLTEQVNQGLTILLATHDLNLANKYTHRIVRMNYGRMEDEIS